MSMRVNNCPCCGSTLLLRHVRHGQIYWLCQSCRQEVQPLIATRLATVETIYRPAMAQSNSDS
ncbi:hypothetical protein [Calothrix sp. 336/3]|uniref:hypothetical protein n=1 Tax=Calothrix sp. 336/3 TaxID=1337936 RepID=UPI0004E2EB20|nr:hypothetical protein [Calothrix sp. 336/3]AKG21988.1 hypothetical protein IJ00_12605 [Calothrix sp. 336/3]